MFFTVLSFICPQKILQSFVQFSTLHASLKRLKHEKNYPEKAPYFIEMAYLGASTSSEMKRLIYVFANIIIGKS